LEKTKESWHEAEVNRTAGEIALKSPVADAAKAEAYFERALTVARAQQPKSWELRAAMSMARLWRDQGKRDEARRASAPVGGWFTEGFDTLDLKEARKRPRTCSTSSARSTGRNFRSDATTKSFLAKTSPRLEYLIPAPRTIPLPQ
jgi:predicted ATPase